MAITYYKYSLQIKNTHIDSLSSLANLLLQREEYDRAIKYYKHALQIVDDNVELLYGYSLAVFRSYVMFKDRQNNENPDTRSL